MAGLAGAAATAAIVAWPERLLTALVLSPEAPALAPAVRYLRRRAARDLSLASCDAWTRVERQSRSLADEWAEAVSEFGRVPLSNLLRRLRALGFLPALLSSTCFAAYRGLLDTATPLKISLAYNLLNALLDPVPRGVEKSRPFRVGPDAGRGNTSNLRC